MRKAFPLRQPHRDHDPKTACISSLAGALTTFGTLFVSPILDAAPARAETPQGCLHGDWIREATQFVVEETGFEVPEVCVRLADEEETDALFLAASAGKSHGEAIAGLYVPPAREILLAQDLDPATALGRSYLVHELVHAQQFERDAHERASCSGTLEGEAYYLQSLYLRTNSSSNDMDAFLLQLLGMLQSACGSSY